MDIVLLDYGTGNLHSLGKALERGGARVRVEADLTAALRADALVLPGVGSFAAAAMQIAGGVAPLRTALAQGMPCLGICLGMQLLFESSEEGPGPGIGALGGKIRQMRAPRVPQMGWNSVLPGPDRLFAGLEKPVVYYANSYVAEPTDPSTIIGWTEYGNERFPAAVRQGRTWGVQFHPEKSGRPGLRLLGNFLDLVRS
jgi:imidazole glycerol-phosphate synthase subunit HisH